MVSTHRLFCWSKGQKTTGQEQADRGQETSVDEKFFEKSMHILPEQKHFDWKNIGGTTFIYIYI